MTKNSKKSNPSMGTKHVLVFGVGALVGGGIGYAVGQSRAKTKAKEVEGEKAPPIPPLPGPGMTPGGGGPTLTPQGYRPPESTRVQVPRTPGERDQLDATICSVFRSLGGSPSSDDVTMGVLSMLVPDVEWPTVEGDHSTMIALQAMVGMRVQQIAVDTDPSKTPTQNLEAFCPQVAVPLD